MLKTIARASRAALAGICVAAAAMGPAMSGGTLHISNGQTLSQLNSIPIACRLKLNVPPDPMKCDADVHIVGKIGDSSGTLCMAVVPNDSGEQEVRWLGCSADLSRRFHVQHMINGDVNFYFGTGGNCIVEQGWQVSATLHGNFIIGPCNTINAFNIRNVTTTFQLWTIHHPASVEFPEASEAIRAPSASMTGVQLNNSAPAAIKFVVL
jgi:hypothetical protein